MRDGLCEKHVDSDDEDIHDYLVSCDDCRHPGQWIGEGVEVLTNERIREQLS